MNSLSRVILGIAALAMPVSLLAAEQETPASWPAFTVPWVAQPKPVVDLSHLLKAPAGGDGFVTVKDGHFARGDGQRLRIWGINITMAAAMPAKENAAIVADNLARLGINCARLHFTDIFSPSGLIDGKRNDTQHFDADQLDRMDYLIAELKKRGIYTNLNLHVGRRYKPGDGVRDSELLGLTKAVTYSDPRIIELQRDYAKALLTHVNPYTGKAYRDEPAIAIVEFVNENSIVEAWMNGRLQGNQTTKPSGTWNDIPPSYASALTEQYNQWLAKNLPAGKLQQWRQALNLPEGAAIPRLVPKEFPKADPDRFRAEAEFYMHLESTFFAGMAKFLREEIGVKVPLIGNSDHGHGNSCYALSKSLVQLDAMDGHVYWQHPSYTVDSATNKRGFRIQNTAMVNDPLMSSVVQLSRSAVIGKPYTVSEANHPFPAEHASEGVPILAAYAAMQDWDGIFWYTLAHRDIAKMDARIAGHFDFAMDPVKMTQVAAGAMMFLRGDIAPAKQTIARSYSQQQIIDSMKMSWRDRSYFTPGFPLALPLMHRMRIESFDKPTQSDWPAAYNDVIRSDTNQLTWLNRKNAGAVIVDSPKSQAIIGHIDGAVRASNLAATPKASFCAITLTALDDQPIASSRKLLLTAGARVANSGMKWDDKRNTLEDWGKPPTVIEPVGGSVTLSGITGNLTAQPLDGAGRPLGQPIPLKPSTSGAILPLKSPTTWYLITR